MRAEDHTCMQLLEVNIYDVLQDVSLIQRRLQEVATPTVPVAELGYASSGENLSIAASKASARQGQLLAGVLLLEFPIDDCLN